VYEELGQMDELMKQYYHIKASDPKKLPLIQNEIKEFAFKINMDKDLDLTEEMFQNNLDDCIQKMHGWITKVQTCDIADGFHILGMIPEGDRFRNMLKMLVRNRNGDTPSLRDGICDLLGLDHEALLDSPETATADGRSFGMLLVEVDEIGRKIFKDLEANNYSAEYIDEIIEKYREDKRNSSKKLKDCLEYVCDFIKPRVLQITSELDNITNGINGKFIPPGPSGAPTRGNAGILPTGRNFYSVDPGAMPSRSSWEIGKTLANQLIDRYISDNGQYPESISVLVWATEAMRNYGDDISETLYLLGVRPVWLGSTDRVIGIEAIPLEELGRPRIDITLRITGLFRDSFPNLIERVDEPEEQNFIKKHVREDIEELIEQGIDLEIAKQQAMYRIFGDPPGAYGAGVCNVVESKKWESVTDLGTVYTTWGGHAYGKKVHGDKLPELFALRMKKSSVAVKNQSTLEVDMLDSDDFYNYFGGMVAAITTHSGEQKPAYVPSTSDTDHIETVSLHEEASRVMRARVNNPKWIEGLKKHGYRGAKQVSAMVDFTFGWDATTNVIDDWMYDCIANRYAFDKENSDWIREVNPWALHNISERLLEAHQRGMWNATEEQVEKLKNIYIEMEGNLEDLG
ncbi:cobaltochelatase subunit CobN, partial [Alkalibaculum bacchi]|uniref:cobaltochelatase subunit CobN n=1 Tax=Alkalibaculum bacchi TaxID=645887 RepID=UPI0026EEA3D6